jgi:F0F1-type ATP synthase membrane subunit c/vacuolar-type H+-ATPase subunit K
LPYAPCKSFAEGIAVGVCALYAEGIAVGIEVAICPV